VKVKSLPLPRVIPARYHSADGAGTDYGATDPPDWRTIDWRANVHQLEIAGTEVNYLDIGEQGNLRPIVMLHGLGGQWQHWLENIPRFSRQRRVVAIDMPGFGLSEMPHEEVTIELYARVVAELSRRLDLAPVVVVGNSMGGYVAAELAIDYPQIVERLMLVSAAGVSQADIAQRPLLAAAKAAGLVVTFNAAQLPLVARRPHLRHWALNVLLRHPSVIRSDMAYEGLMKGTGRPGFGPALRACLNYDFRERLPQIGCPTLVVWGERDMIIPVSDADRYVRLIPGARKRVLPDTGHLPMVERPPTFDALLEEFLGYRVSEGELEGKLDEV